MTAGAAIHTIASSSATQRSAWHSPVPYLFGGLAAMLGLIAFALMILACSYWKLSGDHENTETETDLEAGDTNNGGGDGGLKAAPLAFQENFLVIMAGHENPTFLATPVSRASSRTCCSCSSETSENTEEENEEKKDENSTY